MRRPVILFAAAMVLIVLAAVAITWSHLKSSLRTMKQAEERRLALELVLSSLKDAETGQRGFALTGAEKFLGPLREAENQLMNLVRKVVSRYEDQPLLVPELEVIQNLVQQRLSFCTEVVVVRREKGLAAAAELVATGRGRAIMNDLRNRMETLIGQERRTLTGAKADMEENMNRGMIASIGAALVALLSGGVAVAQWRQALRSTENGRAMAEAKNRAELADRQKSSFLATMSHEIRTPMNAILGFGELLRDQATDDRQRRHANSIMTAGHSLLQLINDILDISKIESGEVTLKPEPLDVRQVLEFIRMLFAEQITARGLRLELSVEPSVPRALLLDAARLRQILINLVGNAVKFTRSGQIRVTVISPAVDLREQKRVPLLLSVEDTGIGIPADMSERIFDPFFQASAGHDRLPSGTGLGLPIVRRLVDLMGGTISLVSEVGRGTSFMVQFPAVEVSPRLPVDQDQPAGQPRNFSDFEAFHVLVVDDNSENRTLINDLLQGGGHRITFAANGAEALTAVIRERPSVVLMDLRMPGMNGYEALEKIRELPECALLPVVAVTASSLLPEEGHARQIFNGYIRKPFGRSQLYSELRAFLPVKPPADENVTGPEMPAELAARLNALAAHEWKEVLATMAMSAVRNFAGKLAEVQQTHPHEALAGYTARLHSLLDEFDIAGIERAIKEFPSLLQPGPVGPGH